jgi:hypothetical protein
MPGFDGTGPLGLGPMTGMGRGFCILRLPHQGEKRVSGYAGLAGRPVEQALPDREEALVRLRLQVWSIELAMADLKFRLAALMEVENEAA